LEGSIKAVVNDPQTTKGFVSSHVTYLVHIESLGYAVRRRYNDFLKFHDLLSARFGGMIIPPLPDKVILQGDKQQFQLLRMRGMEIFLCTVMKNAFLKSDNIVHCFLSKNDGWESAAKKAEAGESLGYQKWTEVLEHYELPENTEQLIGSLQTKINLLEKVQEKMIASNLSVIKTASIYGKELKKWCNTMFEAQKEADKVETTGNTDTRADHQEKMKNTMNAFDDMTSFQNFQPAVEKLLLHEVLRFELKQILELKKHIKKRDALMDANKRETNKLSTLEMEHLRLVQRGQPDKAEAVNVKIEDQKKVLEKSTLAVNTMTKGLFFAEVDDFWSRKIDSFQNMMGEFAATQHELSKRQAEMWKNYVSKLGYDVSTFLKNDVVLEKIIEKSSKEALMKNYKS